MILKTIKNLAVFGVFFFPFALWKSFAFPLSFSHAVFMFTLIEVLFFLFLFYGLERGEVTVKRSWLTVGLVGYIAVLFITAISGMEWSLSFWSSYLRLTGIVTWLHYASFFLIISSVFSGGEDWKKIFRALSLSGFLLSLVSFLGIYGAGLQAFNFLSKGGSFLGNTSYNGAYLLLIFYFSFIGFSLELNKKWKIVYIVSMLAIFFNPDLFNFGIFNGSVSLLEGLKNPMLLVGIARTSSLVLWAGLLLVGALFLINKLKEKRNVIIAASGFLMFLFGVYLYGFMSLIGGEGRLYDFYVKNSGPMRPMVWQMAVEGIKDRPLLGWGDGNFKYVYQENLRIEIIHLENPPWFDRVHNFTLEEFIGHGILGASVMIGMFILIVVTSFKFYMKEEKLYFLLIPFIFFLHFLQLQTFFQVDSTLLLCLILLAFLVSHHGAYSFKIPKPENVILYQAVILILTIVAFVFFVVKPIQENRLIPLIKGTKDRNTRLSYQEKMKDLKIDPMETFRQTSIKFVDETIVHAKELKKANLVENIGEEYKVYIDVYGKYMDKYSNLHRFLFEYANLINSAFIFGVDELKKGEELARKSLEISTKYPYPHLVLALNLYYQGRIPEALESARTAYELDPTYKMSEQVYRSMEERAKSKNPKQGFFYLPIN